MVKNKLSKSMPFLFPVLIFVSLGALITILLRGTTVALLMPRGLIATEQRRLLMRAVLILLEIAIPTLTLFYYTAWKYRESNKNATHSPSYRADKAVVFSIWAFPFITMVLMASLMWPATHRLAPQKALSSSVPPINIQVIALRWKWLFIYPDQNIATVNYVALPTNTPVQFDITADEMPMSSFWIPQLAGQLYSMTGHLNRLNIMATTPGDYAGSSAELNGPGFAGMKFTAHATTAVDFAAWVQDVKNSDQSLTIDEYQKLLTPSENNTSAFYSQTKPEIFSLLLEKYSGSHGQHAEHE